MPMPLSVIVSVRASRSKAMRIFNSGSFSNSAESDRPSKRSLSAASEALEISSRRKMSLLEYKEWIINCNSCLTSAWKPRVSLVADMPVISRRYKYNARRNWGEGVGFQAPGSFVDAAPSCPLGTRPDAVVGIGPKIAARRRSHRGPVGIVGGPPSARWCGGHRPENRGEAPLPQRVGGEIVGGPPSARWCGGHRPENRGEAPLHTEGRWGLWVLRLWGAGLTAHPGMAGCRWPTNCSVAARHENFSAWARAVRRSMSSAAMQAWRRSSCMTPAGESPSTSMGPVTG